MQIQISLSHDEEEALSRFGHEVGAELSDAAKTVLRDWLLERGYLQYSGASATGTANMRVA